MIRFDTDCSLQAIFPLHMQIYGQAFPMESLQKKQEKELELKHIGFFQEDILVGYCIVIDYAAEKRLHAWVGGTLPEQQGKGIFSQFYDWLIQTAKERGYQFVSGNTDNYKPNMLRLLIQKGFDIVGVEHTAHGDGTKVLMRYTIYQPTKLRLSITSGCNFDCFFCHHDGVVVQQPTKISLPALERILVQARKLCVEEITITGGEPATYFEAIAYVLKYCANWGKLPKIKIASNGVLWTKERIALLKPYAHMVSMNLSFHSTKESVFPKLYGCQPTLQTYQQLFKALRENGITFRINTTILANLNHMPQDFREMLEFAFANKIASVHFMELLLTRTQTDLIPYYCSWEQIRTHFLEAVKDHYTCTLTEENTKKVCYAVASGTQTIRVSIYRLSCRSGCQHCAEENDITIGADEKGHPCYLDPEVCCGDAVQSLRQTIEECKAYISRRPANYHAEQLYWGD